MGTAHLCSTQHQWTGGIHFPGDSLTAGQLTLASGWELAQGSQSGTLVPLHTAAQASSQRGGWIPITGFFFFFSFKRQKVEVVDLLRPGLRNWHIISAATY